MAGPIASASLERGHIKTGILDSSARIVEYILLLCY